MVDLRLNLSVERQPLSGETQPPPPEAAALLPPGTAVPAFDPQIMGSPSSGWPRGPILTRDPSRGTPDLHGAAQGAKSQQQRRQEAQEAREAQEAQEAQEVHEMLGHASPEMEALAAGVAQEARAAQGSQTISMDLDDGAPPPEPTLYSTQQAAEAAEAAAAEAGAEAAGAPTPRHFAAIRAQLGTLRHTSPLCPYYMCRQLEISASMRKILVEWLIELHDELGLPTEARP